MGRNVLITFCVIALLYCLTGRTLPDRISDSITLILTIASLSYLPSKYFGLSLDKPSEWNRHSVCSFAISSARLAVRVRPEVKLRSSTSVHFPKNNAAIVNKHFSFLITDKSVRDTLNSLPSLTPISHSWLQLYGISIG